MDKENKDIIPTKTKIQENNIPDKIKKTPYWGLWEWRFVNGQWTKVPVDSSGSPIDAKAFNLTFKKALKLHNKAKFNGGIGLLFTDQHDYYGIDYDDCVVDGKISKAVIKKIKKFDSYYEISVSGAGIHVMGSGASKLNGVDRKMVYSDSRYFTFTGQGSGKVKDISKLVNKYYAVKTKIDQPITGKQESDISFSDLRSIIMNIRPDLSEPDWFLVCKAIHYKTNGSKKGWKLFHSWSKGEHCKKKHRYKLVNETPGQWEDGVVKKWNRCKDRGDSGMVGLPTLRRIESEHPISTKKQKKISHRFKQVLDTLKYDSQQLPLSCLPNKLQKAAKEVAKFNKVPVDPVITSMLINFSAAINKKVVIIERGGREHNCSMGCIIGMSTGGRKSAIDEDLMKPYFDFEKSKLSDWSKERIKNEQKVRLLKKRLKIAEKESDEFTENGAEGVELDDIQVENMANIQKKINEYSAGKPKYIESDVTEERLSDILDKNNETIFIQSDDARNTITNITGRYDSTSENIYISGITGSPYRRSRVKDDIEIVLHNPCVNMSLKVQLDKLVSLVSSETLRESGLIARLFLKIVEVDAPNQIREDENDRPLDNSKMDYYNELLTSILNYDGKPVIVTLNKEAAEARRAFTHEYADLMEGEWSENFDVSNKIVTLSVKMATVLAIIGNKNAFEKANIVFGSPRMGIGVDSYKAAVGIVKILMGQTLDVLNCLEKNTLIEGAKKCLVKINEFLDKTGEDSFTYTDIHAKYGGKRRDLVPQYLALLYENGLLSKKDKRYSVSGLG